MSYQSTIEWMFKQLPMYQRVGKRAYKADLSNTITLAKHLGNPQEGFRSIHVGGTNGKGSTSHMLASVLMESGYKVGLYTSPHLKDFRERISINGELIQPSYVVDFVDANKSFFSTHGLSFFEMTVGLAFSYFQEMKVDVAVIEVGLGGRLDSTNIITPELSVITNIGFDHMELLGNTYEKIAFEKAGIIKPGVPVVIGETNEETKPVFISKAEEVSAPVTFAENERSDEELYTDLKGLYQSKNVRTAYVALQQLKSRLGKITEQSIEDGLKKVVANTGLRGRWDILADEPLTIADTAHNQEGLTEVMRQLVQQTYQKLYIVLGFVNDKNITKLLPLFPKKAHYLFCAPDISRAMDVSELKKVANGLGLIGDSYNSVSEAVEDAKSQAKAGDCIFIGGSTFVVAEAI